VQLFCCGHYNGLRQRRSPLPRSAIINPGQLPWHHIYQNEDEDSLLELSGFNRRSFGILVNILFPNPVRRQFDRPHLLDCSTCPLCNIWTWIYKFINRCIIIYWHIYDGPCSGLNTGYYKLSIDGGTINKTMSTSSYYPEKQLKEIHLDLTYLDYSHSCCI